MHKRLVVTAALVLAAADSTFAWAGWGCGFDSDGGRGAVWAGATEEKARANALHNCETGHLTQCRIISCSAGVDSMADAEKFWPRSPGVTYKRNGPLCGGAGEPPCPVR